MTVNYNPRIVTDGLVLCLDAVNRKSYSGSGSTWTDLSLSKNNATLTNTPLYSSATGGYLGFTSTSSQYAIASNPGSLTRWTVETLVGFTSTYNNKIAMVVGGQYNGISSINFSVGTNNYPSNYNIAVGFFDGSWHSTTGVNYDLNTWYHIVGTYDGTTIRQFTNGTQVDSLNYVGTPSSGGEIRINRRWDGAVSSANLLDTNISVVRIYNRALSTGEIQQNYNAIKGRFSTFPLYTSANNSSIAFTPYLSLLLHMDGANGSTTFTDSSLNALTVSPNNGTTITTSRSKFGGASASFVTSWLSSSYNSVLDLMGSDFTVEAWIYPITVYSFGTRLASSCGSTVAFNGTTGIHWLIQLVSTGNLQLQIYTSAGVSGITGSQVVNTNAWNHIAICVSGTTVYAAVNGVVESASLPAAPLRPTSNPTLGIGLIPGESPGGAGTFYGNMDDFRILKGLALYTSNYTVPTAAFTNP